MEGQQTQIQKARPVKVRITSANKSDTDGVCRDFVWGICIKGLYCKYRHELQLKTMKNILRFCHDFQNRTGCNRPGCTYLHTTCEEENLFLRTGRIPKVLRERYASMLMQPPPPPPLPAPVVAIPPAATLPLQLSSQLLQLIPIPPPPPPRVTATVQISPLYTVPLPADTSSASPASQPTLPPIRFDPSKPPPPLTSVVRTAALKRPHEATEAGPSKASKQDTSTVESSICESCNQRKVTLDPKRFTFCA